MEDSALTALESVAQVATGIVGFSALVLAVSMQGAPLDGRQRFQLKEVVRTGVAIIGLCFVPVTVSLFGVTGSALWRTSSALHVFLMVLNGVLIAREQRGMAQEDREGLFNSFIGVLVLISMIIQVSNVIGYPLPPSAGPYFAAMLCGLALCAWNFTRLLLPRL